MSNKTHSSSQNPPQPKRVFSKGDEILILKGLADFKSRTGIPTMSALNAFYESRKHLLSVETTQKQFCDKVWKLKGKYEKNLKKKYQESFVFSDRHDEEVFKLSDEFWTEEKPISEDPSVSDKMDDFMKMFTCMNANMLKSWMSLVEESERQKFDRRLMRLKVQEAKLNVQRAELFEEQIDLIYKALQGSS